MFKIGDRVISNVAKINGIITKVEVLDFEFLMYYINHKHDWPYLEYNLSLDVKYYRKQKLKRILKCH